MNKNLVKYPIRFGTLLLAGAALVACKKEEFTEKDAWNLENQRLTRLAQLKKTSDSLARVEKEGMFKWQRSLDSLDKINAGGRVFYTVIPVNASEAVFAGGRTEEAITGATVTATQFGRTVTGVGANGVFTFPEMRSGEVTVNITAPNFTQVNYISNLTPDGGIRNDGVVNVGNVIPMFELPGAGSNAAAKFAVVRGQAWFEGDLTDATAQEERVTPTILGANTNLVTATIDLDRKEATADAMSAFHKRFIVESNDESGTGSIVGGTIRSGAIQRFSFSRAVSYGTVAADGAYSMLIPASAAGLPVRLNYSEFAFNRTYFNDRGATVTTERFLYGPNVAADSIARPNTPLPSFRAQAFTTAAAASAVFTPEVPGTVQQFFANADFSLEGAATIANPSATGTGAVTSGPRTVNRRRGGFYVTAPTVTHTGGAGTGATFVANLTRETSPSAAAPAVDASLRTNTAAEFRGSTAVATNKTEFERSFGTVGTISITAGGTGYTGNGSLSFTRTDIISGAGFGGQTSSSGAGGYVNLSDKTPIQVTDGGANFLRTTATTVSLPNTFTNYLPTPVFTESNQAASADPTVGYVGLAFPITSATARVFTDYNATYTTDFRGVNGVTATAGGGVGSIQEVRLSTAGSYPAGNLPFVNFSFGETVNANGFVAGSNKNLFVASATQSVVQFNTTLNEAEKGGVFTGVTGGGANITITANAIDFIGGSGWGSRYTFVPTVQITPNASAAAALGAAATGAVQNVPVICTVSSDPGTVAVPNPAFGKIIRLQLTSTPITGLTFGAGFVAGSEFLSRVPVGGTPAFSDVPGTDVFGISVLPNRYGNTLAAVGGGAGGRTVASGSALNTYSYTATAQTASAATNLASAMGGAISNTTTEDLSTADYLAGNNMLVVFSNPNNTTVATRRVAWGVPTFNGNVLLGARILDGGLGYTAPTIGTVNFTSEVTAKLVPNPWFRGNVPVTGVSAPSSLNSALQIGDAPAGVPVEQDIEWFLNSPFMTAQGSATRPTSDPVLATLRITLDNVGAGYSVAPRVIVSGGGLNLTELNTTGTVNIGTAANPLNVSNSAGGVIGFSTSIDADGRIIRVGANTNPGTTNINGGAVAAATPTVTTYRFDAGRAPRYTSNPRVDIIDDLSVGLTNSLNRTVAQGGVGAKVIVSSTGTIADVRLNDGKDVILPTSVFTAAEASAAQKDARSPRVDIQTLGGDPAFLPGYQSPLVRGPQVTLVNPAGFTGTTATVQAWVTLDPTQTDRHRRVTAITVTSPGAGYNTDRINAYVRRNNGGPADQGTSNGNIGQNFAILGGAESGSGYNGSFGQTNERFDAHPGRAYVRDVHYGTGRRID